jgi:hypothetical protein
LDVEAQLVVVCVKCPINFGKVDFELDLVCLPLSHMDVIFDMDLMLSLGVNINCLTKSMTFSTCGSGRREVLDRGASK